MASSLTKADYEKLIHLVQQNQVLYDSTTFGHRDQQLLSIIWENIAEAMGKDIDASGWKKKWKNLRDTYQKEKREANKTISSQTAKKKKKKKRWRWADAMEFLDSYLEFNRSDSNVPAVPDSPANSEPVSGSDGDASESGSCCDESVSLTSKTTALAPTRLEPPRQIYRKATKRTYNLDNKALLQLIENARENRLLMEHLGYSSEKDADEAFVESCVLRMKRLSPQYKSFVQYQFSQLLFNAENPTLPPVPIIPLPAPAFPHSCTSHQPTVPEQSHTVPVQTQTVTRDATKSKAA